MINTVNNKRANNLNDLLRITGAASIQVCSYINKSCCFDAICKDDYNVDFNKPIRTGSITKMVTAYAVAMLHEKKLLNIDSPANNYLNFNLYNPYINNHVITIRNLLNHTSSIVDNRNFYIDPNIYLSDRLNNLDYKDNNDFQYCNLNYVIIGEIIQNVTRQRYDKWVTNNIFKPLGINAVYITDKKSVQQIYKINIDKELKPSINYPDFVPDINYNNCSFISPQGGLHINMSDLVKLGRMFMKGYYENVEFINKKTLDTILCNDNKLIYANDGFITYYALGFQVFTQKNKDKVFYNNSSLSFGHFATSFGIVGGMFMCPDKDKVIAYCINGCNRYVAMQNGNYSIYSQVEEWIMRRYS